MPEPRHRLRSALAFLLPTPLKGLALRGCPAPLLAQHHRTALGLSVLLLIGVAGYVLSFAAASLALVFRERLYLGWRLGEVSRWVSLGLAGLWLLLWLIGLGLALAGSARRLPLITWLGERRWPGAVTRVASAGLWSLGLLVAGLATHASTLVRPAGGGPARVYVLYDDLPMLPRWAVALSVYRLALASRARFGPGQVVMAPISPGSLREAFGEGTVVFVASHGRAGTVLYDQQGVFTAGQLRGVVPVGQALRLVYLTACHGGQTAKAWQQALWPARVVSFDRLSATAEHGWWLWVNGPVQIRRL